MSATYDKMFQAKMPIVPDIEQSNLDIPMRDGYKNTGLLIKPTTPAKGPRPLIVLFFGGGFIIGAPDNLGSCSRAYAALFDAVVIAPNYRLAPENPFPTAPNDAWDSLQWAAANAGSVGADPSAGFIVGGESSGGNLAAVAAQRAKEEGLQPALTGQWLCIPVLLEESLVPEKYKSLYFSRTQCAGGPLLDKAAMDRVKAAYGHDVRSPQWSPVNSEAGLEGLPKTFMQVCGRDHLRDDGLVYERLLKDAGVETKLEVYPGVPHAMWVFYPMLKVSQKLAHDMAEGMGWLLGKKAERSEVEKMLKLPMKVM